MRFLLYNIRYAAGSSRCFHLPLPFIGYLRPTGNNLGRIAAFIKEIEPDVVGLLEVDSGTYRSEKRNQAEVIADALGHYLLYQSKYKPHGLLQHLPLFSKQGNAFLTRHEIKNQKFHYFEHGLKRLVIELELEQCVIFLVHLSIVFRHRHYQLRDLHELIQSADKPVLVGGDFNLLWGAHELKLFLAATGLVSANVRNTPSHPSRKPHRQLDFILHSPALRVRDFFIPSVRLSDHMPLVCDLDLD